ncbi:hypothetical protein GO755_26640 [Spirosoma sp. HMF4905]|uniref:Uncharacterized protein n=1 Tax=Spirosoma arboris TaxID=2682092 RepID=A0A7K1SIP9_9BACT|nr:hypothetical protein [Spirosoma arboris]MVM33645.1 hypothetical protein [Spirosoma arboris]
MESQNLWPEFEFIPARQPKTILREQANFLIQKTKNILSADIESSQSRDLIYHRFIIYAPALNNYRYELLVVRHTIITYPLDVFFEGEAFSTANDEGELLNALSNIFNHPSTKKVLDSLLSQSIAE